MTQDQIAAAGTPLDVRAPGDTSWRAFDPTEPPEPGTQVRLRSADGKQYITTYNGPDDFSTPVPTSATGRTPTRNAAASDYPSADEVAPNASAAAKKLYTAMMGDRTATATDRKDAYDALVKADAASGKSGVTDANTKALAQAAVLKAQNGQNPTQSELEAYFKVRGQQTSGYAPPVPGYSGKIAPHDSGNANGAADIPVPAGTTVDAITGGTVKVAGAYGTAGNAVIVQGNDGRQYMFQHIDPNVKVGDTVTAGQPLGVVSNWGVPGHWTGPHVHIAVAGNGDRFETDHGTTVGSGPGSAASISTPDLLNQVYSGSAGSPSGAGTGGTSDLGLLAPKPEIHALGNKLYQYDPASKQWSVAVDATNLAAPTTHAFGNVLYQWTPGQGWTQALVGPKTPQDLKAEQDLQGKVQTVLTQMQSTKDYIAQQLSSGAITPDEAQTYLGSLNDYTAAALQGTTPYERYKFQMEQQTARVATAKDLLDTKMQAMSTMADSVLGHAVTGLGDYGGRHLAPGTLAGLYGGAMDEAEQRAKPLTDLAQSLLRPIAAQAAAAGLDPRIPTGAPASGPAPIPPAVAPAPGAPGGELPPWMQQAVPDSQAA